MPAPAGVDIHRELVSTFTEKWRDHAVGRGRVDPMLGGEPAHQGSTHLPVRSSSSPVLRRFPMAIFSSVRKNAQFCASGSTTSRDLPGPILREWWVCSVTRPSSPRPGIVDSIGRSRLTRCPSICGRCRRDPPPFESIAEKRSRTGQAATPPTRSPAAPLFGPGVTDRRSVGVSQPNPAGPRA